MPKRIVFSERHERLMTSLFSEIDYRSIKRRKKGTIKPIIDALQADGLQACEDTIRRHAVKMGLIEPVGAKYVPRHTNKTWTRPCMHCGDTKSRPKNLYLCETCRQRVERNG